MRGTRVARGLDEGGKKVVEEWQAGGMRVVRGLGEDGLVVALVRGWVVKE